MAKTAPITLIIIIIALGIGAIIYTQKNKKPQNSPDGRLKIAASFSPLADMAGQIGGSSVDVASVLPPGASPHTFNPAPEQIRNLQGVKIFFTIGHGFDDWVSSVVENTSGSSVVSVDKGIQLRELPIDQRDEDEPGQSADPHYWLAPANAKIISQNIAAALIQADPVNQETYASNLNSYLSKLDQLDLEIRSLLSNLPRKELITHHNAWGYFADAYGLNVAGTFEISPGKEPSPQQIADLQNKVRRFDVETIFSEPQLSEQSLVPFVRDLNLKTAILDPEGGLNNMGYIDMMRYNASTIAEALK